MSNQIDGKTANSIVEYYMSKEKNKKGLLLIPSFDADIKSIPNELNRLLKLGYKRRGIRRLRKDEGYYIDIQNKEIMIGYFNDFYAISYSIVSSLVLKKIIDELYGKDT